MILVDSNIIIDLLGDPDAVTADWSRRRYAALRGQELVCNHIVLAEVAAGAASPRELVQDLEELQVEIVPLTIDASMAAGRAFGAYRRRGGKRETILADFLIAGHAEALGAALMTRDRRLAAYFPDLSLITPETHPHG